MIETINDLVEFGGLNQNDIADITGESKATVLSWKTGKSKPEFGNQLILSDLFEITNHLRQYYSPKELRTWLFTPHPQLENKQAADLLRNGYSFKIRAVIKRLDNEVFV